MIGFRQKLMKDSEPDRINAFWSKAGIYKMYIINLVQNKASCGANAQQTPRPRVAHRGIARFLGIDQKCNQLVPWSLDTFSENFLQIGPAVYS